MPALKPRQSACLRKIGGMAENEDGAIRVGCRPHCRSDRALTGFAVVLD